MMIYIRQPGWVGCASAFLALCKVGFVSGFCVPCNVLKIAYVVFAANGDAVAAATSGFTLGKDHSPTPPIQNPKGFVLESGPNPGELLSKSDKVEYGVGYLHQYADDAMMAQNIWHSAPSSRSSLIIANLTPGVKYNCRIVALGTKDQLMYSPILSRIVA